MTTFPAGCFGKLPIHGDFIRHPSTLPAMEALDEWFQEGIVAARESIGSGWQDAFDAAPPRHFVFHADGFTLVGVVVPGRDKVGRRYPFFIFTGADTTLFGAQVANAAAFFADFFDRARDAALHAWKDADLPTFLSRIDALAYPVDLDVASSRSDTYLSGKTLDSFWSSLFGAPDDPRKFLFLYNLLQVLQQSGTDRMGLALRFPAVQSAYEVSAWMTLVQQLSGSPRVPTFALWDAGTDGLSLLYDVLTAKYFVPLVHPEQKSDRRFDLCRDGLDDPTRMQEAREKLEPVLEDSSQTLGELLTQLSTVKG